MKAIRRIAGSLTAAAYLAGGGLPAVAEEERSETGSLLGRVQTVYPEWFKESFLEFADDVQEAADEGRRVVIFFHQDGCPYCNALVERNLSQKHIEEKMRRHFDVIALNLRGDRDVVSVNGTAYSEKDFARALNVQFTPTLLFLDESGKVVLRLNGYVPPEEFEIALDYAEPGSEPGVGYREYLENRLRPSQTGSLNDAPFFDGPPHDLSDSIQSGKPVAVFFEQRDCPSCDTLHREVLDDPQTIAAISPFHAVQLDMWSDTALVTPAGQEVTARGWAEQLGVRYAPTIVLFSADGDEVIRSEAVFKRFHTQSLFDYVAGGAYRQESDFQRFLTDRATAMRAQGQDVDIWK
jgi:thioredoxin-related protein